jgi:hypothetical protein
MRILLIVSSFLFAFSADLSAQSSFKSLDARTYDYYLKGDLKNLEKTADTLFTRGIDYYYLRIRLAITAFNNQRYSIAVKHFKKAVEFNSTDTVSTEYIYNSYLFSGREADANLYLRLVPSEKRNRTLKLIGKPVLSEIFAGSSASFYNVPSYQLTDLNSMYEALQNSFSINAGLESYLSGKFKGTFAYTNFRKSGIVYSRPFPIGDKHKLHSESGICKTGWICFSWLGVFRIWSYCILFRCNYPDTVSAWNISEKYKLRISWRFGNFKNRLENTNRSKHIIKQL